MICGRNVCSVPRFDVATGQVGEARRTAMAQVRAPPSYSSPLPLLARRSERMVVAFILLLVAVGSVLFHIYSPWWWTPIATNWNYIDHTISITFWITGAVFFAVIAFMAYCVLRFHHKEG